MATEPSLTLCLCFPEAGIEPGTQSVKEFFVVAMFFSIEFGFQKLWKCNRRNGLVNGFWLTDEPKQTVFFQLWCIFIFLFLAKMKMSALRRD